MAKYTGYIKCEAQEVLEGFKEIAQLIGELGGFKIDILEVKEGSLEYLCEEQEATMGWHKYLQESTDHFMNNEGILVTYTIEEVHYV